MFRIFKVLTLLFLGGFAGLVVYAYLGDLSPQQSDVNQPVSLNVAQ
jgi:hypothetical protein